MRFHLKNLLLLTRRVGLTVDEFAKENHLLLWEGLVENGYEGKIYAIRARSCGAIKSIHG